MTSVYHWVVMGGWSGMVSQIYTDHNLNCTPALIKILHYLQILLITYIFDMNCVFSTFVDCLHSLNTVCGIKMRLNIMTWILSPHGGTILYIGNAF